jgi:hypothetical protein
MVVVMVMIMIVVVVIVIVLVDGQEFRLDVQDTLEIERPPLQHVGNLNVAFLGAMQPRVGVDRPDPRFNFAQFR